MVFLLPLTAHFLGDFVFQNSSMASGKRENKKKFALHCLIYSSFIIFSVVWFGPVLNMLLAAVVMTGSHILIDHIRNKIPDKLPPKLLCRLRYRPGDNSRSLDFWVFLIDQVLKLLIIIMAAHLLKGVNSFGMAVENIIYMHVPPDRFYNAAVTAFLYILCLSPAAVFIKKVFILFSFQSGSEVGFREDLISSGYLIGILERIIILTLGLNGQLGAIGFVIAAKSLARFNQLNDKSFAEKYLTGTLLSVVAALMCIVLGNALLK